MLSAILTTIIQAGPHKSSDITVEKKGTPQYICPDGFELKGKICERDRGAELTLFCEQGDLVGDVCKVEAEMSTSCRNGYYWDGSACVKIIQHYPKIRCPDSTYKLDHGDKKEAPTCKRQAQGEDTVEYTCPQGTMDNGHACVTWSSVQPTVDCPNGEQQGAFCVSYVEYDCSPGGSLGGSSNKKSHHLRMLGSHDDDEIVVGSKGYESKEVVQIKRLCRKTVYEPAILNCPGDAIMDGKECKRPIYHSKIENKASGMNVFETAAPENYCEVGDFCSFGKSKKHSPKMCCEYLEDVMDSDCPTGYDRQGTRCIKEFEPIQVCPNGSKKKKSSGGCNNKEYKEPIVTYQTRVTCTGKDCI